MSTFYLEIICRMQILVSNYVKGHAMWKPAKNPYTSILISSWKQDMQIFASFTTLKVK